MSNQDIRANLSHEFKIDLSEKPSTGYRWKCVECPPEIVLVEDIFHQSNTDQGLGATGSHQFTFLPHKAGNFNLRFELKRSWEQSSISNATYSIIVQ